LGLTVVAAGEVSHDTNAGTVVSISTDDTIPPGGMPQSMRAPSLGPTRPIPRPAQSSSLGYRSLFTDSYYFSASGIDANGFWSLEIADILPVSVGHIAVRRNGTAQGNSSMPQRYLVSRYQASSLKLDSSVKEFKPFFPCHYVAVLPCLGG
jgi:hypothetical protein